MSTVNKINVNGQVVDISNSGIEIPDNITANDVSYDASTQYDENTVGDKLSELEKKTSDNGQIESETTESDSEDVVIGNSYDDFVVKVNEDGVQVNGGLSVDGEKYNSQLYKTPLGGKYHYKKEYENGIGMHDANNLCVWEYDVTNINGNLFVGSILAKSNGIVQWFAEKNGVQVARGVVNPSAIEHYQLSEVDVVNYDTLFVNGQLNGRVDVYSVGFYKPSVNTNVFDIITKKGKIGLFLGDSSMQGEGSNVGYDPVTYAQQLLSCTCYNGGIGGTTMRDDGRGANLVEITKALLTRDWTNIDGFLERYYEDKDLYRAMVAKINEIKTIDPYQLDFIFISYGSNDFYFENSIIEDDNPDNPNTTLGALRYCVNELQKKYQALKIYVSTPSYHVYNQTTGDSDAWVHHGMTLGQLSDKIENVCKTLHVPCHNQYWKNDLNRNNATLQLRDGTHRNAYGYEILGHQYAKFIMFK